MLDDVESSKRVSIVKSAEHLAIPPIPSKDFVRHKIPSEANPRKVSFNAYSELRLAAVIIEPSVSPPIESGLKPAATPTADPVDEPPGFCNEQAEI